MKRANNIPMDQELCSSVALVERNTNPGGVALVSAAKVAKKDHNDIVQLALEIRKANDFVHANVCNKLQVIAQQVRFLQEQAVQALKEAKVNTELHHTACNFVKVPGNVYHLYRRESGQTYLGMLSPQEWNTPHEYMGSFRLENDHSWTPMQNIPDKDTQLSLINKIISSTEKQPLSLTQHLMPMEL